MSSHKASYEKWHTAISALGLKHRHTCTLFNNKQQVSLEEQNDACVCGRLKRSHSYERKSISQSNVQKNSRSCSVYQEYENSCGILYNPYESRLTKVKTIYFLFVEKTFLFV
jgi:hypothetical protein